MSEEKDFVLKTAREEASLRLILGLALAAGAFVATLGGGNTLLGLAVSVVALFIMVTALIDMQDISEEENNDDRA